jgi:hypothetical protein
MMHSRPHDMLKRSFGRAGWLGLGCLALGSCSGAPPPEQPEAAAVEEETPAPATGEEAGHDLDVGMEFADEEQEDESEQESDRGPPPTQTYSPASRMEEDSKAIGESTTSE